MPLRTTRHKGPRLLGLAKGRLKDHRRRDFLAGTPLIDRKCVANGQRDPMVDPAMAEEIADVGRCSSADLNVAIAAAQQCFRASGACCPREAAPSSDRERLSHQPHIQVRSPKVRS